MRELVCVKKEAASKTSISTHRTQFETNEIYALITIYGRVSQTP